MRYNYKIAVITISDKKPEFISKVLVENLKSVRQLVDYINSKFKLEDPMKAIFFQGKEFFQNNLIINCFAKKHTKQCCYNKVIRLSITRY